jgi:hypothetical protein
MAVYNNVVVTDAGITLLRNITLQNRALNAAGVVTSASVISNPKTATTIPNVAQNQDYSLYSLNTNQFVLEAQLTNVGVSAAYYLNTIGFYANDGVTENVLIAVITAQTPDLIPPESSYPVNLNFKAFVSLDSGGNVTVNASFAGYATMETLGEHMTSNVESDGGVHGIRYSNKKLQLQDGSDWRTILKNYSVFGVSIDLTNPDPETSVTYTDDAIGMSGGSSDWDSKVIFKDIKPCVLKNGVVQYYLNPNDFTKKADGSDADITSGADGDVMIEFPKTGVLINTSEDGNTLTVKITEDPNNPDFHYYAHSRDTEGDRDKLYIGAYKGSFDNTSLRSLSGKTPYLNQTIGTFRNIAQANGAGYDLFSFYPVTLIQCLYLIRFKNLDSQTALGRGYVSGVSQPNNTGTRNKNGMFWGTTIGGNYQMKCFGIEDFWGNTYDYIDGLCSDANNHILTAFKDFNDTGAGYIDRGQGTTANLSGYMSKPQGTTEMGFIAKEINGSASTYFSDNSQYYTSRSMLFGGYYNSNYGAGVFAVFLVLNASNLQTNANGRLMYL